MLILGAVVEVSQMGRDQFGRTLGQVRATGFEVNAEMVASGHALATSDGNYLSDQEAARAGSLGIWDDEGCGGAGIPVPALAIVSIDYDPPGPDDAEEVVLANRGTTDVSLTGYTLRDESSVHRYRFTSLLLPSGGKVTISTGCGVDTDLILYWCAGTPVWNNGGDTALLLDQFGRVIAYYRY
jgi:hypothetical protein